ncbi:HNH endonuclease [Luteirhabdus pelagi]|uniref:HNH endonuclease n=1 Tax=Luteirhabdus pelagi TaxID=2792783 RepID=UPI001939C9A2|nr:HNH endonuclease [Luteirhabdus pelagi]
MTGNQLNNRLNLNAQSARYRKTGDWYHPLVSFPAILFDQNGYVRFETEFEYSTHPQIQFGQDIHINGGIQTFPSYTEFTTEENIIVDLLRKDYESALRVLREYSTYRRNQSLVLQVKEIFNNSCALCETTIQISENKYYSEVHHIKPLYENGPDDMDNMICVCPNCHVKLDLKLIRIDIPIQYNPNNHFINQDFIDYHNNNVA